MLAEGFPPLTYLFCTETRSAENDLSARFFFEAHGVREDPATGNGAAFLARYLRLHGVYPPEKQSWRIEQGHEVRRPSLVQIRVRNVPDATIQVETVEELLDFGPSDTVLMPLTSLGVTPPGAASANMEELARAPAADRLALGRTAYREAMQTKHTESLSTRWLDGGERAQPKPTSGGKVTLEQECGQSFAWLASAATLLAARRQTSLTIA